jgi:hypothetical protein
MYEGPETCTGAVLATVRSMTPVIAIESSHLSLFTTPKRILTMFPKFQDTSCATREGAMIYFPVHGENNIEL